MIPISSSFSGTSGSSLPAPLGRVARLTRRLQDAWTRNRTERALEGLPFDMRKDIGWPASDSDASKAKRLP
ncbi:MAG: hypothetical protein BGO05_19090 [Rhizobiales bacterium 63-7]|nr:hypothetical protein [Hyphomicrobiales bacterium]OJU69637.1 MAG: hypothetical protein BGO05_19090 [Rhizobiales bacterium 63-7]